MTVLMKPLRVFTRSGHAVPGTRRAALRRCYGCRAEVAGVPDNGSTSFTHSAFLYDSPAQYLGFLVPFIREGLERGESVAVATSRRRISLLRDALGDDAPAVRFLPADEWYVRPVRTIAGWAQMLRAARAAGRPAARLVGEVDFRGDDRSWTRFESAQNAALTGPGHLVCPYDRSGLPRHLIDAARRTHHVVHDDGWHHSDEYVDPERFLDELPEPLFPVHGDPVLTTPVGETVVDLRAALRDRATAEGWLTPERVEILVLAISEIATNGIRHGGHRRELHVWVDPDAVVCEVVDDGPHPPGPLAGYLPPTPGTPGGMGLWLVGQTCDAFSLHTAHGVTRARFALRRS
jgi:anti-sigma regulatory factor (Ser/Thr protein kinase)